MGRDSTLDAVIVGSGPNGLTAAAVLARAGLSVQVLEARETIGGGCRTAEVTLPGFRHDICSAIHPMGRLSPIFAALDLQQYGLRWIQPPVAVAHPLPDGPAALLHPAIDETAAALGADASRWRSLLAPLLRGSEAFFSEVLRPIRIPRHPVLMARFGLQAIRSAETVARSFQTEAARALFMGCAAHSILPLDHAGTAAFGLILALSGHAVGWPVAEGGSVSIVEALRGCLAAHGGTIETGRQIRSLRDLPPSRAVLFDLAPRSLARIAGSALPGSYLRSLERFRHGPGVFKIDWALDGPIPWRDSRCLDSATVHLGGAADEIVLSERNFDKGAVSEAPFVLVAQQSLFDSSRAPSGQHTGWGYCHVPSGCPTDMTARIERQIERFAPGFQDRILLRHIMSPRQYEDYNPNFIGGDIGGGANTFGQFLFRPCVRWNPYTTPDPRFFLCSSSTPPGGGVHGMCGYWAAHAVLKRRFGKCPPPLNGIAGLS